VSHAVIFEGVSKHYRLGGAHRSLRDALGSLSRRRDPSEQETLWALRDVSFEIKSGEALAVVGPNGAGKSTILKLIGNIIAPTQGRVIVRGRVASLLELGAGFHPDLTGRENIFLNGAILGMKRSEIKAQFDSIVDFAELHAFIDTPVKRYSAGMYMRLAFAIAVHVSPDILLLDEVLAVGDKMFQEKSLQKTQELQSEARTVVFVSHNLYAVQSLCQRGIFLDHGDVRCIGTVQEAVKAYEKHLLERGSSSAMGGASTRTGKEWRSNGVRIEEVRVCDAQGIGLKKLVVGQPLAIQIGYHAERRIERPIFAVQIKRADGVTCAAASTKFDGFILDDIETRGKLQVVFEPMTLAPGTYTVDAHIHDQSHSYPYASWRDAAAFKIMLAGGDEWVDSDGIYRLPHQWDAIR
jgi:lipopolysaccharide transport system ATP-binding protein